MTPRHHRRLLPLLLLLALPLPAAAQGGGPQGAAAVPPGIPEALRGTWFGGASCARPEALLFLTARAALRLPAEGAPVLQRFATVARAPGGWTVGTAPGPEGRRLALRGPAGAEGLETAEPAAKTRDDRLPGEGAGLRRWQRCPQVPAATAALHAEGVAALAALEHVEAACDAGAAIHPCLAALHVQAAVTGDGLLSLAELARLARGAAWIAAAQEGRAVDAGPAGDAGRAALAAARSLLEGLDYDGDGRLSLTELAQDRAGFGAATGTAQGQPPPGGAAPGAEAPSLAAFRALLVPGVTPGR
jgi:hypothetical protein